MTNRHTHNEIVLMDIANADVGCTSSFAPVQPFVPGGASRGEVVASATEHTPSSRTTTS